MDTYPMSVTAENVKRLLDYVDVVEHVESYVSTRSGEEIDRLLDIVDYNEYSMPVGVEWDTTSNSPTLRRIDINGNTINPSSTFFDNHQIWGGIKRCVRSRATGNIYYGTNNKGSGLALDGSAGDVLVEIPIARTLHKVEGNFVQFFEIPYYSTETQYAIDPAGVQRGGIIRPKIYVSAYEASIRDDNGVLKLQSIINTQPITGGEIYSLAFTSGSSSFVVGNTVTGGTSGATGIVIGAHTTSGTIGAGDAAGVVYLRQCSTPATFSNGEALLVSSVDYATSGGTPNAISLTMDQAEGYGNAIGSGFGITNIHTASYIARLMIIEYGTFNLQTAFGRGAVDLGDLPGFVGKLTGADSITNNLASNGTGVGSGGDGLTPICWRGIENPYGNVAEYAIGINASNVDNTYKIISRKGTSANTLSATLASGTYETGTGVLPSTSGAFVSNIQAEELGALALIPSAVNGSSSTYLCDLYTVPAANPSICTTGGSWNKGSYAGVAHRSFGGGASFSNTKAGCRIEYIPQA